MHTDGGGGSTAAAAAVSSAGLAHMMRTMAKAAAFGFDYVYS